MINIEVEAKKNENGANLLRRFSRHVQRSGLIYKAKAGQYRNRPKSDFIKKRNRLKAIEHKKKMEQLIKEGKMAPKRRRY